MGDEKQDVKENSNEDGSAERLKCSGKRTFSEQNESLTYKCQWSEEMHKGFLAAIFDIGLNMAKPKDILRAWSSAPSGLHADHIKSHLQKYRKNAKRTREVFNKQLEAAIDEALFQNKKRALTPHLHAYPICATRSIKVALEDMDDEESNPGSTYLNGTKNELTLPSGGCKHYKQHDSGQGGEAKDTGQDGVVKGALDSTCHQTNHHHLQPVSYSCFVNDEHESCKSHTSFVDPKVHDELHGHSHQPPPEFPWHSNFGGHSHSHGVHQYGIAHSHTHLHELRDPHSDTHHYHVITHTHTADPCSTSSSRKYGHCSLEEKCTLQDECSETTSQFEQCSYRMPTTQNCPLRSDGAHLHCSIMPNRMQLGAFEHEGDPCVEPSLCPFGTSDEEEDLLTFLKSMDKETVCTPCKENG